MVEKDRLSDNAILATLDLMDRGEIERIDVSEVEGEDSADDPDLLFTPNLDLIVLTYLNHYQTRVDKT